MAVDKLIDGTQLDAALTATAYAIRVKTDGSAAIPWDLSMGFMSAITDIPSSGGGAADAAAIIGRTVSGVYENNMVKTIGSYAFRNCTALEAVDFPLCTTIGNYAFVGCASLRAVNFSTCFSIGSSAFQGCSALCDVSFPMCFEIGSSAFQSCSALGTVTLPNCMALPTYTFENCVSLSAVNLPMCSVIRGSTFRNCVALGAVSFPSCTMISAYAFQSCSALSVASFPVCSSIWGAAFSRCVRLISFYLTGSSVARLEGSSAFYSTPIAGYSDVAGQFGSIYVPASLLTAYQSATNWAYFSSRFVGLTDEEIAALEGTA